MSRYHNFLASKHRRVESCGVDVDPDAVHPFLHERQRRIVVWAARRGRAALWEDTGLGKTAQLLEFARLVGERSLIIAPLAVCHQTVREAANLGIDASYVRSDDAADGPGVWVTNYERADRFDSDALDAVVLDEASLLKQSDGKTRTALIRQFANVKHRLTVHGDACPERHRGVDKSGRVPRRDAPGRDARRLLRPRC